MLVADPDAPRGERAKLLDFGIVKILQEAVAVPIDDIEGQTQRGMILGTPLYMAPEQWKNNRRIDGKSDVYSLAVMMFLVLTGRMPFRAADTPALCFLHCNKAPPSLDSVDPSLPAPLVDLVARMLAKDPRHRPTMDEVAASLGAILAQPAAPRNQPMLPEPSELEIISEPEDDESSGVRPARSPMLAGEHPPLVDRQPSGQQGVPVRSLNSATLPVITPPSLAEAPAWADDNLTTASVAAAEPGTLGQLPELSDGSLLVGSQYNLRPVPMLSVRAWVSTGALLVVVLLLGADAFAGLSTWHRWRELFAHAHIVALTRPGHGGVFEAELASEWYARRVGDLAELGDSPAGRCAPLEVTALEISASAVRAALARGGSARYLVPAAVDDFIRQHALYGS